MCVSYPPGQSSGHGQDDWGTVPSSGPSEGSGPNLSKGDQGQAHQSPEYAPTEFGQTYQPNPSQNPYEQNPYDQNQYGQNQYGQNPYGQNAYGSPSSAPYGQPPGASYGRYTDPYQAGQAPAYGTAGYGSQNAYGAAPYGGGYGYGAPQQKSTNGKAIGALISGIVGLVMLAACFLISFPVGIAAVVLGVMSRREVEQSGGTQTGSGMGLAGIITGALSIVGALVWVVLFIILIAAGNSTDSVYYY